MRRIDICGTYCGEPVADYLRSLELNGWRIERIEPDGIDRMGNLYRVRRLKDNAVVTIRLSLAELSCDSLDYTNRLLDKLEAAEAELVGSF